MSWFSNTVAFYKLDEGLKLPFLRNISIKGHEILGITLAPSRDLLILRLSNHMLIFFSYRNLTIYCDFILTELTFTEVDLQRSPRMTDSHHRNFMAKAEQFSMLQSVFNRKENRRVQTFEIVNVQFLSMS